MAATALETYRRTRGGPVSQEITYGWYPPSKNIWKSYGVKSPYEQECLYRHDKSRFKIGERGMDTPIAPTPFRMELSPRPDRRSKSPVRLLGDVKTQSCDHSRVQSRAQSAKVTPKPPSSSSKPRAIKSACYFRRTTAPEPNPTFIKCPAPTASSVAVQPPSAARQTVHTIPTAPIVNGEPAKQLRAKSAPLIRSAASSALDLPEDEIIAPKPPRVQSAQGYRQNCSVRNHTVKSEELMRAPVKVIYPRPFSASPVPPTPTEVTSSSGGDVDINLDAVTAYTGEQHVDALKQTPNRVKPVLATQFLSKEESPAPYISYAEQLQKYGWRMQVHGDPLNLKRPTIKERKPMHSTIPEHTFAREGPKRHMENWDTYFLNTIPRRAATFDLHPEMISEVINAKRMELQKRDGGIKYRYKNFSFVY